MNKPISHGSMPLSMKKAMWYSCKRDALLLLRRRMDLLNPLLFGFIVVLMFPLGLGPSPQSLAPIAPGLIWIVVLLSSLLATDGLFKEDFDDGSLSLLLLSPQSVYFLLMARLWVHWLGSGFIVALVAPLLGMMLYLPLSAMLCLVFSLLIGSVSLVFIGGIGAALTVGLKNSGVLLTLIILPLYVPILIFGSAAVNAAAQGMAYSAYLSILAALLSLSVSVAPLAVYAALKNNVDAG